MLSHEEKSIDSVGWSVGQLVMCYSSRSVTEWLIKETKKTTFKTYNAVCTSVIQLQYKSFLHLCGPLQYNAVIQVFYNLQKTAGYLQQL